MSSGDALILAHDFGATDPGGGTGGGGTPPSLPTIREITAEIRRLITQAQAAGWRSPDVQSSLGAIKDWCDQIDAQAPPASGGGTGTPPAPPARTLGPGRMVIGATSTGQQMRVSTPNLPASQVGLPIVLTFAGSGFQGAPLGALPAGLTAPAVTAWHPATVANQFLAAGAIYAECAYRGGAVALQVTDAQAAYDLAASQAAAWGGDPGKIVVVGHSSGGYLGAWLALTRPVALATLMSGAALEVTGYAWPPLSAQLLASAGVGQANCPGAHLAAAHGPMNLLLVIAQQDEQIPPPSERDYAAAARQAGHTVSVQEVPGLHGASIAPGLGLTVQALGGLP